MAEVIARPAAPRDVVIGAKFWLLGDEGVHRVRVEEVLRPNDPWKAFDADDGCRYGLEGLFAPHQYESDGSAQDAYADRNLVVLALARLAVAHGYAAGVRNRRHEWPIVMIELPTGQISYHVPRGLVPNDLPDYHDEWDGHTLLQKRERVLSYVTHAELVERLQEDAS